jgi:acyl-CoA thioesterase
VTDFATVSALTRTNARRWTGSVTPDWAQGRTTYGGLVAAIAARAAAEVAGPERPIRTMDIAFVAPLPAGGIGVDVDVLGSGRAVTQLGVSLHSGDAPAARVHVVAGAPRPSAVRVCPAPTALTPGEPLEQGMDLPYRPGITPVFTQQFQYRWVSKTSPFTGGGPETALIDGWMRHRTPAAGMPALVALLDAWPPAVLPMLTGPTPVSTVRWAIHLAGPGLDAPAEPGLDAPAGEPWVWYEARTVSAEAGYATAQASMYTAAGRLLAWSEQLITVYDRPDR